MNDRLFRNRARPRAAAARHSRHRARRPHRVAASGEPPMPDKPSLAVMPFQNMRHDPRAGIFRRRHGRGGHLFEPPFLGRSGSPAFAGSSKVYAVNPRTPPSLIFSGFPGTITPELHTATSASSPSPPLIPRSSILAVVARIGSNRSDSPFLVSSSQTSHDVNATVASPSPPAGQSDGPHPPSRR